MRMIKKLWSGIKKVNPWLAGVATILSVLQDNYPAAVICLMLLILLELSGIREIVKGEA